MHVGEMVRETAKRYGNRPAIVSGDRTLSFRDFDQATDRLGNALLAKGLRPGDAVGVLLPNGVDGLVVYYALAKSGLVRVSLNVREQDADHADKLGVVGCRALIAEEGHGLDADVAVRPDELAEMLERGPEGPPEAPRDLRAVYRYGFTGGTTGRSKAVTLTLANEHSEVANFLIDLLPDIRPGDAMLHAAPVTHASGAFFLPHLLRGACNVVLPRFDPGGFLEAAERTQATATFVVPTMLSMLLDEPNVGDAKVNLRRLCYGAAPAAPSLLERAQEVFGPVLANTYGQAEAPMTITCLGPEDHQGHLGSAGKPYTLVQLRVVDEEDRDVPVGGAGEVITRGPHVFAGYHNQPEETAATLRGGWLHTGDIGTLDGDGFLYLLDRRHDLIISGGFNVYPREVEDVLLGHPAVTEAAVVGLVDDRWGETVHAVVATRARVTDGELLAFAADRLAGYKRPRSVELWQDLPKSGAGKILRRAVRDQVRARHAKPETFGKDHSHER
jgi:acyl-CoA synthetase (AMP-forming)/AMP-acid ligase II